MTEGIEKNKLWGCLPTKKNLATVRKYRHFKATNEYCLVISPDQPEGAVEMTDEFIKALTPQDWAWIETESAAIRSEYEEKFHDELMQKQKEFIERFRSELIKAKEGLENAGEDADHAVE